MRALKSETSGVPGGELLSVLLHPDGTQTRLDDCVAQVATICAGGGEVTAVVLGPKKAFEVEWGVADGAFDDGTPLVIDVTDDECENYDWFQQWDRMMVVRRSEVLNDTRAEAALLDALRRRLARSGPWANQQAVDGLVRQVFGEQLHHLDAIPSELPLGSTGYEMQRRGMADDVTVASTRPVYVAELDELLPKVFKDWRPVLQRSAVGESHDSNYDEGFDILMAMSSRVRKTACSFHSTVKVGGAVLLGGIVTYLAYRASQDSDLNRNRGVGRGPVLGPGMCPRLGDDRTAVVWSSDGPAPLAPCGSGTLLCGNASVTTDCDDFGSPWPISFPSVWNTAKELGHEKCEILCHKPEQTNASLARRLTTHFPLQHHTQNTTMFPTTSREEQVQRILAALTLDPTCSGSAASWREIGWLEDCQCSLANVTCEVTAKRDHNVTDVPHSDQATHNVTLLDLDTPLDRVSSSFGEYPEDRYTPGTCVYECKNLTPEAKNIVRENKEARHALASVPH